MAKKCELKNIESKGSSSISVDVLHDGEGFILVSYNHGPKKYQGVLMETNRSGVPSGVKPPAWFDPVQPGTGARSPDPNDPYHTVSTRMTYFQTSYDLSVTRKDAGSAPAPAPPTAKKRHHHHHKGGRSTVRLRPRQVLCSNCKSMCTESSQSVQPAGRRRRDGDENVDPAAAAAAAAATTLPPPPAMEMKPLVQPPAPQPPPPPPSEPLPPPPPLKVPRIPIVRLSAQQLRRSSSCAGDGDTGDVASGSSSGSASSTTTSLSSSASSSPTPPTTPTLTKLTVSPIKIVGNNVKKCDPVSSKPKLQKIKISGGAIVPPPKAAASVTAAGGGAADGDVARRTGLRKKRLAVGSMEDLWDESVLDDGNRTASSEQEDVASLTPVLKISFGGREGAGTVLKIPAKYKLQAGDPESERPVASGGAAAVTGATLHPTAPTASAKAAKLALKKARKDVQRKLVGSPRASPAYHPWGARSPAYPRLSPSYPQMSPAYYRVASAALGLSPAHPSLSPAHPSLSPAHPSLSPAHPGPAPAPASASVAAAPAGVSAPVSSAGPLRKKRHKHKLKHKRRRRERCDRDEPAGAHVAEVRPSGGMKERCLSQKLSISLRRIRASEYAADSPPGPSTSAAPAAAGDAGVPPFPSTPSPSADTSVSSCQLPDGRRLRLNDVIWGKVHGFPWWPGKVMCINDGGPAFQEAYVSWYGSTTSSLMPCSQLLPFLDTFESRVNRKRRGPYREAVRQATLEAERALPAAPAPATTAAPAQGPSQSPSQPPLALAGSPPEVDVAS